MQTVYLTILNDFGGNLGHFVYFSIAQPALRSETFDRILYFHWQKQL